MSYNYNHTVSVLLSLASFIQHNVGRFIHVVTCIFLPSWLNGIVLYEYAILCSHIYQIITYYLMNISVLSTSGLLQIMLL